MMIDTDINPWEERTLQLLGAEKLRSLHEAHILVAGLGGVGGYTAEMLARAGIGEMTIVDADKVQPSNVNRQLIATQRTVGESKASLMATRLHEINPALKLHVVETFLKDESIPDLLHAAHYDFVADAIDTLSPKCYLIYHALNEKIPIISSMGAGAKSDITQIRYGWLSHTYHCALSRAVRKRLAKMGLRKKLPVVFSSEQADSAAIVTVENEQNKKSTAGTISYMPAVFGCYLAAFIIQKLKP